MKPRGQIASRSILTIICLSDFKNLGSGQFRAPIPAAALGAHLPFLGSISDVSCVGAKEQVSGIYAARVITGMTYLQAGGNRAKVELVRKPVCSNDLAVNSDGSVSVGTFATSPNPTPVCLLYLSPQPIRYGNRGTWSVGANVGNSDARSLLPTSTLAKVFGARALASRRALEFGLMALDKPTVFASNPASLVRRGLNQSGRLTAATFTELGGGSAITLHSKSPFCATAPRCASAPPGLSVA